MKKRLLIILLLLTLPFWLSGFNPRLVFRGSASDGNGGPDTWYYCDGHDAEGDFPSELNEVEVLIGCEIKIPQDGTITKLKFGVGDSPPGNVKIGLYDTGDDLHTCKTVAGPSGWQEVSLSGGEQLSVNTDDIVTVEWVTDGVGEYLYVTGCSNDSGVSCFYDAGESYASACPDPRDEGTTTVATGAAVYVD